MTQQAIDAFIAAVEARLGRLETADLHDITRAAKLVRLDVEAGTPMSDKRWEVLFSDATTRELAQQMLTAKPAITEIDFDKTAIGLRPTDSPAFAGPLPAWAKTPSTQSPPTAPTADAAPAPAAATSVPTSPGALAHAWHSLLTAIPPDGLPANDDPAKRLDFLELGRMILDVSQGRGPVAHARIPEAAGFRARFIELARAAGRTELVTGLPPG